MNAEQTPPSFDQWGILEVMGHNKFIGRISEQVIAGTGFIRVDIPETKGIPAWTKFVGTSSVYGITPLSEELARAMARELRERPVQPYEIPEVKKLEEQDLFDGC